MKRILPYLFLLVFLFSAGGLVAQKNNTLAISIGTNSLSATFNNKTIGDGKEFKPDNNFWKIIITNTTTTKYTLVLSNIEATPEKITISKFPDTLAIDNNKVKRKQFNITETLRLALLQDGTTKKEFTLHYKSPAVTGDTSPSEDIPSGDMVYRFGSAVHDANTLKNGKKDEKIAILAYYASCSPELDSIKKAYDKNKFLTPAEIDEITNETSAQSEGGSLIGKALSAAGGLDVTNLADGLARFLVNRTKEELNIAFFDNLKDYLTRPEFKDLQTVFPETYRTFLIIGDEVYNIDRYILTLRESFRSDLGNLTTNLRTIVDNHPQFFEKYPALRGALFSELYIAESIRDKKHPGVILEDYELGCPDCLEDLNGPVATSIQVLRLFSESLKDSAASDTDYWVKSRDVKKMLKDSIVTRYYFGLMVQLAASKYDSIPLTKTTTFVDVLNHFGPSTQQAYRDYINRYVDKTERLTKMIKDYSKPASDSLMLEQYYSYFKATVDLLEYSVEVGKLPYMPTAFDKFKKHTKDYFDIANASADLTLDINRKNYSSAVRNAVYIYDIIKARKSKDYQATLIKLQDTLKAKIRKLNADVKKSQDSTAKTKINQDLVTLRDNLEAVKAESKMEAESESVKEKLFKYGTFMANLVNADSPEEVQAVIESFALPAGSARIKRETCFNVALNAYVGLYAGNERIRGLEEHHQSTFGLMAPVGVSISRGHSFLFFGTGKHGWSTSLFFSVIDVGAIASFRFTEGSVPVDSAKEATVYSLPKVELKDIISPGVFLSIGIPKTPLSLNAGYQIGPNLRKVSVSTPTGVVENTYSNKMYQRWSFSLVVDIPIINFYTKSRD
jgi:hypothetical protein